MLENVERHRTVEENVGEDDEGGDVMENSDGSVEDGSVDVSIECTKGDDDGWEVVTDLPKYKKPRGYYLGTELGIVGISVYVLWALLRTNGTLRYTGYLYADVRVVPKYSMLDFGR